jgi:hypothetical protein
MMEVFDETFVPVGLQQVWTRRCPRCIWPYLHPIESLDGIRLLCDSCGHCWRVVHGNLRAVDPITCQGCAARSKRDCITLVQSQYPRFGPELDIE